MKKISKSLIAIALLFSFTACDAQIKNAKIESVKIYGNCGMCETTIEKAGNLKKIATVDWNKDTKMAILTYDATKTSQDEILKRIALAGYDSDKFLAPVEVYDNLPGCCQYDRIAKVAEKTEGIAVKHEGHSGMITNEMSTAKMSAEATQIDQLAVVYDNYFAIKDALVKTDGTEAASKAAALLVAINAVKMDKLEMNVHMIWMKMLEELKGNSKHISETKDVSRQRTHFKSLSTNIYALIKVSKTTTPTYYQFCPMADGGKGANWLSKESAVKNPYYGSQMLSCGKTVETIK